mmetsp:Transcript_28422/g.39660  ORF Transcript_28422/g.39660 Transcript_28422/m.39660 type:complete len:201 (+) Transcript_28422:52-654(+)|eukprot:CAMPEP_0185263448 /NCGR_PEP_ID=MMETSP1359-20130426/15206_1 /TAXON_ID=552665 /ORGANISM="Bigelowiella longifila, Strain CCMP242" /LENGTH=200 /DNA_ID=CAMNT_0027851003 /DNA_START=49 /DNA_END=651 /DNA_ORIENTATION=+
MQERDANTSTEASMGPTFAQRVAKTIKMRFQNYLDRSTPYVAARWGLLIVEIALYALRVYYIKGFHIVTYALAIFILNLFIGFLSPIEDPEGEGPLLPTSDKSEFKPFMRRLPEFKFWYGCAKAVFCAFCCTFIPLFNIPVFWPILLMYFFVLFILTMKRQIRHMVKHKYIPISFGKKSYAKAPPVAGSSNKMSKVDKAG